MSTDSVRSDSIDNSESILPYKHLNIEAASISHVTASVQKRDEEISQTKDMVNSRVAANRSIGGFSGKVESKSNFPVHAAFLLRTAGRCTHPSCSAARDRGMELARAAGFQVPNSTPAPIPSIAVERKYYPENPKTGKQDRKNPQTYIELKPADPKHPEWLAAKASLDTTVNNLYFPEDLLAHHHDD